MKTRLPGLVCVSVLLCASPSLLPAGVTNGIQMVSENYDISASWNVNWWWLSGTNSAVLYPSGAWDAGYQVSPAGAIIGGYSVSSADGSPVAAATACASPLTTSPLTASASIGLFSVQNNANSAPEEVNYPAPIGGSAVYSGAIQTSVQGDWLFSPVGNLLEINLNASLYDVYGLAYGSFTATLKDVTSSTTLLTVVPSGSGNPVGGDYTFAVSPNDVYEFNIAGWSDTYGDDFTSQSVTTTIMSVPEPATWTLLAFGLAALVGFTNRSRM